MDKQNDIIRTAANSASDTAMLHWALNELLGALPARRDWLNPDAEKVLREVANATSATPAPIVPSDPGERDIRPDDLRIETWRKNRGGFDTRPDNCCRITHVPTGITVTCEDEDARSVHAAKADAMKKLRAAVAGCAKSTTADALVDNLAALVGKLAYSLRRASPGHPEAERAVSYLTRKGLAGSPLRLASAGDGPSKAQG